MGIEEIEDDGVPFEERMEKLTSELSYLFKAYKYLKYMIKVRLKSIGYEL